MALEDVEKKLYKQGQSEEKIKKKDGKKEVNETVGEKLLEETAGLAELSWPNQEKINFDFGREGKLFKINRFSHWFFWILAPVALILMAVSGYYLYQYFSIDREINFSIISPDNAMAGAPFEVTVNFDNNSKNTLKSVELSVFLPEGAIILGENKEKRVFVKKLDDLNSDTGFKENIPLVIFGDEQTIKNFKISVSYVSALSARFEKVGNFEVAVKESGIKLDLTAPEKVLNNQEFETTVNYSNISENDFSNVRLNMIYSQNLVIKDSNPKLTGNSLLIGNLAKGQSGTVSLRGKIIGPEQSFFEIKSQIKADYMNQNYLIAEKKANLYINPSPLSLKIIVNDSDDYISRAGDVLRYKLFYKNNTDISLSDVVIKVRLSGEMFDFLNLRTNSSFDSRFNNLVWNAASIPDLQQLSAGAGGSVEFEISTKPYYPIKKLSDKNFTLKANAEISSPTVPYFVAADKTIGLANLETKIGGQISVESQVYFRDPSVNVVNNGSLPPKANSPINFIIHWIIRNYATDVKDINVRAVLEPGVKLVSFIKNSISTSSMPIYNDRTQEIIWTIDRILAAKGIVSKPVEAIFQVEVLPNITQIGKEAPIIGQTSIIAKDEFTNLDLSGGFEALTTKLLKDSGLDSQYTQVVQ